jgi:uncharacterized protein
MPRAYRTARDLPEDLPVFPLPGAVLYPRAGLPLNIFEPRYLAMVDAALSGDRLIGMIQPRMQEDGDAPRPLLSSVGCAGRITAYQETEDGRYLIVLSGVCRFRNLRETTQATPFRTLAPGWKEFDADLGPRDTPPGVDREGLLQALKGYLKRSGYGVDWDHINEAPLDALINSLSADCPFSLVEKQALLEAPTLEARCNTLITLLHMEQAGQNGGYVQ